MRSCKLRERNVCRDALRLTCCQHTQRTADIVSAYRLSSILRLRIVSETGACAGVIREDPLLLWLEISTHAHPLPLTQQALGADSCASQPLWRAAGETLSSRSSVCYWLVRWCASGIFLCNPGRPYHSVHCWTTANSATIYWRAAQKVCRVYSHCPFQELVTSDEKVYGRNERAPHRLRPSASDRMTVLQRVRTTECMVDETPAREIPIAMSLRQTLPTASRTRPGDT